MNCLSAINARSGLAVMAAAECVWECAYVNFVELFMNTGLCYCQICDPRGKIVTIDRRVMAFIIVVSIISVNFDLSCFGGMMLFGVWLSVICL